MEPTTALTSLDPDPLGDPEEAPEPVTWFPTVRFTEATVPAMDDVRDASARFLLAVVSWDFAEVTDDKSLPKAERKRLQVVNAPKKSVRAQAIKLADKISNLRAIRNSPPVDWTEERKAEYFDWAKRVVAGLTAPNPVLKAEFDTMMSHDVPSLTNRNEA